MKGDNLKFSKFSSRSLVTRIVLRTKMKQVTASESPESDLQSVLQCHMSYCRDSSCIKRAGRVLVVSRQAEQGPYALYSRDTSRRTGGGLDDQWSPVLRASVC